MFKTGFPKHWSTLRKLLWLKILTAAKDVLETVTGNAPITLTNAVARAIHSLTQTGLCTQASTPTPSSPIDIKCNNGALKMVDDELPDGYKRVLGFACNNNAMWEITDFHLRGSDTVKISFSVTGACNVWGCYQSTDATDNYDLYATTSIGGKYLRYGNGTYLSYFSPQNQGVRFDVTYTPRGTQGMPEDSAWEERSFESANSLLIGSTTVTGTSSKLKGNFYGDVIVENGGVKRLHLVPCERLSDNVLGYYDLVGEAFYEPYEGFDGAVSLGYDGSHYVLRTVGTAEKLSVLPCVTEGYAALDYVLLDGGQKLATSITGIGSRVEVTVQSTATDTDGRGLVTYDSNYGGMHVYVKDGDDYSLTSTTQIRGQAHNKNTVKVLFDTNSSSYNRATLTIGETTVTYARSTARPTKNLSFFGALATSAKAWIGKCWGIKIYQNSTNTLVFDAVPCMRASDGKIGFYDKVSGSFIASSGSSDFISDASYASVVNLFSAGSYADTQEIVSGAITRKCGVKVFDGTETWTMASNNDASGNKVFFTPFEDRATGSNNFVLLCTHYEQAPAGGYASLTTGKFLYSTNAANVQVYFDGGTITTKADWQDYLAEQYAAGTPVIVVYPLAEATTESVAGQSLSTAAGTNVVSVNAEVSPIALEAEYYKAA